MRWSPGCSSPKSAVLSPSVPPELKTTSASWQLKNSARVSRARSTAVRACWPCEMNRGGVAEVLHPIGTHGLHHLRQQRGGGVGVHIDRVQKDANQTISKGGLHFRGYHSSEYGLPSRSKAIYGEISGFRCQLHVPSRTRAVRQILWVTSSEICHFGGSLNGKPPGIWNVATAKTQEGVRHCPAKETFVSSRFLYS